MNTDTEYEYDDEEEEPTSYFDDDFDPTSGIPNRYAMPEVEELIDEAIEILADARPLPMSATVKINRDELLGVLEQIQESLPEELRAARWLLKERDDFVSKAREEHKDLIDEGRQQVVRMIEREQIVKAAELRARQIVSEAKDEAVTMKRQVEEFCEQRLASIEDVLGKTLQTMQNGRQKLVGLSDNLSEESISASFSDDLEIDLDKPARKTLSNRGY